MITQKGLDYDADLRQHAERPGPNHYPIRDWTQDEARPPGYRRVRQTKPIRQRIQSLSARRNILGPFG